MNNLKFYFTLLLITVTSFSCSKEEDNNNNLEPIQQGTDLFKIEVTANASVQDKNRNFDFRYSFYKDGDLYSINGSASNTNQVFSHSSEFSAETIKVIIEIPGFVTGNDFSNYIMQLNDIQVTITNQTLNKEVVNKTLSSLYTGNTSRYEASLEYTVSSGELLIDYKIDDALNNEL